MTVSTITLVKGNCQLLPKDSLTISAMFARNRQTVAPPYIIAEFDDNCHLQQVVIDVPEHGQTRLAATHQLAGYLVPVDYLGAQVMFTCAPATTMSNKIFTEFQRRTFIVAVSDLVKTVWHDGFLAHVERGQVLSLIASIGKARLTVPSASTTADGIEPGNLPKLDRGEQARACLAATLACQWLGSPLVIDQFNLEVAVCLTVASSLVVDAIDVVVTKPLTGQWRRFFQNIGAQLHNHGDGLAVSQLAKFVADPQLIAETINRRGAVIPLTMKKTKLPVIAQMSQTSKGL